MQIERTGLTLRDELSRVGLANLVVVPKTQDVWVGINHAIEMFPAIAFRLPQCDLGVEALSAYRQHIEEQGQITRSDPVGPWRNEQLRKEGADESGPAAAAGFAAAANEKVQRRFRTAVTIRLDAF